VGRDQIVPIGAAAVLSSKIVKGAKLKVYPGAPHGLPATLKDQVNRDLLAFIKEWTLNAVSAKLTERIAGAIRMDAKTMRDRRAASNQVPAGFSPDAVHDLSAALNGLLADTFALYLKTKNFHWHMSGPHFRDHHLLLDEQSDQIFAMTDDLAERVRKIGGATLRSIGHIARLQRVLDNDAEYVTPLDMLAELRDDNRQLVARLREAHGLCDEHGDVASASLLENWVDGAERRTWFLFEASRR
jgi:starvation-inducible DNA-binding protein